MYQKCYYESVRMLLLATFRLPEKTTWARRPMVTCQRCLRQVSHRAIQTKYLLECMRMSLIESLNHQRIKVTKPLMGVFSDEYAKIDDE